MMKLNSSRLKIVKPFSIFNGKVDISNYIGKKYYCQQQPEAHKQQPEAQKQQEKEQAKEIKPQQQQKAFSKRGDKGLSYLFTGERRPKNDIIFDVLGETDELSSIIGLASEFAYERSHKHRYLEQLETIQCTLRDLETIIGSPSKKLVFQPIHTQCLEQWIDEHTLELSPQKNFILPSGGTASAWLHIARTKCRTAERRIVALKKIDEEAVHEEVLRYYNRLGDYLFTAARIAAHLDEKHEKVYASAVPPPVEKSEME